MTFAPVSDKEVKSLESNKICVQGIDPGLVTTASFAGTSTSFFFHSINRFNALAEGEPLTPIINSHTITTDLNSKVIDQATRSTKHKRQRERKIKRSGSIDPTFLEKRKVTRKIRQGIFFNTTLPIEEITYKNLLQNAINIPHGLSSGIGRGRTSGHERRGLDPLICEIRKVENDRLQLWTSLDRLSLAVLASNLPQSRLLEEIIKSKD